MLVAILALAPTAFFSPPSVFQEKIQENNRIEWRKASPKIQEVIDDALNASSPDEKLQILMKAFRLSLDVGDHQGAGLAEFWIAKILSDSYHSLQVVDRYQSAIKEFILSGDIAMQSTCLNNIGLLYSGLGEYKTALEKYKESLLLDRKIGNVRGEAIALNNIGGIYSKMQSHNAALSNYEESLILCKKIGDVFTEATVLNNIGNALGHLGFLREALVKLEGALQLRRKCEDIPGEANTLTNIGDVNSKLGESQVAIEKYEEALSSYRKCKDPDGESVALNNLGCELVKRGQFASAVVWYKASVRFSQSRRRMAVGLTDALQKSYAATMASTYRDLYTAFVNAGRFPEADRALAMLEGERLDADSRRDSATVDPLDLTIKFTETEQKYVDAYEAKITAVVERSNEADKLRRIDKRSPEEDAKLKDLEKAEEAARSDYFDWLKKATEDFKGYKPNQYEADKLQYDNVLAQTCGQLTTQTGLKTAALTLVAYDDKTLAVLYLGPDPTHVAYLSDVKIADLNTRTKAVIDGCSSPSGDPQTESSKLLKDLLGPLLKTAKDAKVQVLMTLLDGPVRWLPWQAMWDGDAGKWLGDEFMLPRVTLTSRFNVLSPSSPDWSISAFGNDLNPDGKRHDIPAALEETLAIQSEKGLKATAKNGAKEFDLVSFKSALADKTTNVLHVASHFHLEPGSDKESFLLLGDGTKFSVRDMKSTASVGYGNCELMVLSACQTAVSTGDGATIEGLAASTETKGPKAVMASLWKVNDTATKKLMVRFYGLRAEHKDWTKLQCLATAEKELREGTLGKPGESGWRGVEPSGKSGPNKWKGPGLHPYYWAPFVLFGNWK